jgi:acetylornithine deacetylase/succinyl-diaminopimelate desuccinylase-like protein
MVEKGGRLYGRGASDDKAGVISIITVLRAYQEAKRELPLNVRILVEGGEEYDSDTKTLVAQQAARLDAQALVILDGANRDVNTGTMENSTRGIVTLAVKMTALDKPTHSGVGCLAPDPAQALAKLITSLENPRAIPGLMDDCTPLSEQEKTLLAQSSVTAEEYAQEHGVKAGAQLRGSSQESVFERVVQEPSISVINMNCGQIGGGNSIQDEAQCKMGVRLTPGQDPARVSQVMINYLRSQSALWNVQLHVEQQGLAAKSWKADLNGPFSTAFMDSLKQNYPKTAVMPTGGTLPLIYDFLDRFPKMEVIIVGVEDPQTAAHSHNESQDIGVLRRTMNTLIDFFEKAASISKT